MEIENKKIIRISCNKSSSPVLVKKDFFLRCGPSTEKLEGKELLEYINKRFK